MTFAIGASYARCARHVYDPRAAELRRRLDVYAATTEAEPSAGVAPIGAGDAAFDEAA